MAGDRMLLAFNAVQADFGSDPNSFLRLEGLVYRREGVARGKAELAQTAVFNHQTQPDAAGEVFLHKFLHPVDSQNQLIPKIDSFERECGK